MNFIILTLVVLFIVLCKILVLLYLLVPQSKQHCVIVRDYQDFIFRTT